MKINVTKKQFKEYLYIQNSGLFNMFSPEAREFTSLNKKQWMHIITNYSIFCKKWGIK